MARQSSGWAALVLCLLLGTAVAQVPIIHEVQVVFDELSEPRLSAASPDSKHLYVAVGNAVVAYSLNSVTGALTLIEIERDGVNGVDGLEVTRSIIVSSDGKHVYATGSGDDALAAFSRDSTTGELDFIEAYIDGVNGLDGLQDVWEVTFSPDGNFLYTAAFNDAAVGVFSRDTTTGKLTFVEAQRELGFQDLVGVTSVVATNDGKFLYATGSFDNTIVLYSRNVNTGALTWVDTSQNIIGVFGAWSARISSDDAYMYVAGRYAGVVLVFTRNLVDGSLSGKQVLRDGDNGVDGLASVNFLQISPDGAHLYATGSEDDAIAVFARDSTEGTLTYLEVQRDGVGGVDGLANVEGVTVSNNGAFVYGSGLDDNALAVFTRDGSSGLLSFTEMVRGDVDGLNEVVAIAVSPDGAHAYTAAKEDDALAVFERFDATGELTQIQVLRDDLNGDDALGFVSGVVVSPDGKNVYTAAIDDDAVGVFTRDTSSGQLTFLEKHEDGVGGDDGLLGATWVDVSPDGKHVYVAGFDDDAIAVFSRDSGTGALTFVEAKFDGVGGVSGLDGARRLSLSPDGANVYAVGFEGDTIAVFSRDSGSGALTFEQVVTDNAGGVNGLDGAAAIVVSPDGEHAYAVGEEDDAIAAFARDSGDGTLTFIEFLQNTVDVEGLDFANSLAVSPDGELVYVSARVDNAIVVFTRDPSTGQLTFLELFEDGLEGIDGLDGAQSLAQSADGLYTYVAGAEDDAIAVFELDVFATVSGKILDSATDAPIVCGAIEIANAGRTVVRAAATDENGIYFFDRLPPDTYSVRAIALGFAETLGADFVAAAREKLVIDYSLILAPLVTGVRGQITDVDSGKPLVAVLVELVVGGIVLDTTYTCANGEYEFADPGVKGLLPVSLKFSADNYDVETQSIDIVEGNVTEVDQPLAKSFSFPATLTGTISGRDAVTLAATPLANATVTIRGPVNATRTTDVNGMYAFDAVIDGSYTIRASEQRYTGESVERTISGGGVVVKSFLLERLPSPEINVDVSSIDATPAGGVFQIAVTNTGDEALEWFTSVDPVAPWLQIEAAKVAGPGAVTATIAANESVGPRNTVLYIVSPTASNSPVSIPIAQDFIEPPPSIGVDKTEVNLGAAGGSDDIAITNAGGETLDWDATLSPGADWLNMTLAKRSAPGTITVTAVPNMVNEPRSATITVTSTNAENGPIEITINQSSGEASPRIGLNQSEVEFEAPGSTKSVILINSGGGTLDWDASVDPGADWLTMTISKRTAPATIRLTAAANPDDVERSATVTFTSPNADNAPLQLPITQAALGPIEAGDLNGDGSRNSIDIQLVINVLLLTDTTTDADANDDGQVNASDVQFVINAVLGV